MRQNYASINLTPYNIITITTKLRIFKEFCKVEVPQELISLQTSYRITLLEGHYGNALARIQGI